MENANESHSGKVQHKKLIILGAGPAGLAAALYAARAALEPMVFSGLQPGGQVSLTNTIENYPGFIDGVGGSQLGEIFQKQAEKFGAQVEFDMVDAVDLFEQPFKVYAGNGEFSTDSLIIATGANPNLLQIPGEAEYTGRGVSYCATCDGWFFRDKHVAVVGGGDSAVEEAIFLTRFARSVTIIHRRNELRAGMILQKRVMDNSRIKFLWDSVPLEIIGKDAVEQIRIKNIKTGSEEVIKIDGVFIFIGHSPNTDMFTGKLEMENGYIKIDNQMHTSVEGIFAAGECADARYKQVVTSAGMGAAAAIEATRYLENHGK
jgi:thioredoxin reductase (NADPH)